ncbi:MAG: DUF2459 domain-containing protein [Beijerinckiaceae bacterium]
MNGLSPCGQGVRDWQRQYQGLASKLINLLKCFSKGTLVLSSAVFLLAFVLRHEADVTLFPTKHPFVSVDILDHGYHASLVIPRAALADMASKQGLSHLRGALELFEGFENVEIGWGEKEFYRNVPAVSLAAVPFVIRAMFNPANQSVLHVVGFNGSAKTAFSKSSHFSLMLSEEGFRRSAIEVNKSISSALPLGPGLYGPSAFFESTGAYSLLNTCNHWVGKILAAAGVPYAPVESFISGGLMFDLNRRAVRSYP